MFRLRQPLKRVPHARLVVRCGRTLWRHARIEYLNLRHPAGEYVTCHGVDVALEPDVENFRCLQHTTAHLNQLFVAHELLQAALGESSGSQRLFKSNNKVCCLRTYAEHHDEPCYGVPAMSLDGVVHKYGKERKVAFIKIDIDGPEPLLFGSGRRAARRAMFDHPDAFRVDVGVGLE